MNTGTQKLGVQESIWTICENSRVMAVVELGNAPQTNDHLFFSKCFGLASTSYSKTKKIKEANKIQSTIQSLQGCSVPYLAS